MYTCTVHTIAATLQLATCLIPALHRTATQQEVMEHEVHEEQQQPTTNEPAGEGENRPSGNANPLGNSIDNDFSSAISSLAVSAAAPSVRKCVRQQRSIHQCALRDFVTGTAKAGSGRKLPSEVGGHQTQLRKQAHCLADSGTGGRSCSIANSDPGGRRCSRTNVPSVEIDGIQLTRRHHQQEQRNNSPHSLSLLFPNGLPAGEPSTMNLNPSVAKLDSPKNTFPKPMPAISNWEHVKRVDTMAGGVPPCQRSLHTASVLNGCMYVFGGYDGQVRINDFHSFSFADQRWSPVLPSATSRPPPSPRDRHISLVHGTSFLVFGGFDGKSRVSDFFGFDFSSMTWREILPISGNVPSPRHSHSAVVHDQSMFVFGGYDGSYRSDFHQFDFEMREWNLIQPAGRPPRARYRATCVVHKNTMVLFGGHDGTRHLSDTHMFDFVTSNWSTLITDGIAPIPRDSHVSAIHGDSMYVFGGSTGSAMNDLHELRMSTNEFIPAEWRLIELSGEGDPEHRFCHAGGVYEGGMYIFGGYDGSNRLNDFIKFDFCVDDVEFDVPPSTLIPDLRGFINDGTLSDVTFIVEGQSVRAHKLILTRCSYFRAMFLGEMTESQQSTIRIEQVSHSIFLFVLEYLYTDTIRITLDVALELFVAADLFCIPRLKIMCEAQMLQSITFDNAACMFNAADLHCATALRQKCLKFILCHFEAVSKTPAFEEMARSNVELVFEILQQR